MHNNCASTLEPPGADAPAVMTLPMYYFAGDFNDLDANAAAAPDELYAASSC